MNNLERLQFYVHREIKENFKTAYDFSQTFKCDYKNTCKWYKDYTKIPTKTLFELADYLNMKIVAFRDI